MVQLDMNVSRYGSGDRVNECEVLELLLELEINWWRLFLVELQVVVKMNAIGGLET